MWDNTTTTYLLSGLYDTAFFHVVVHPTPVLSSVDTCEINFGKIDLDVRDGLPPYLFNWSKGNDGDFIVQVNDGTHQIIVSDANQCKDTLVIITKCVEQEAIIHVPQAFTPIKDGVNDFLPVFGDGDIISDFEWSIFNRWGNLVFYTDDCRND